MKYILVLQRQTSSIADYDSMIEIENALISTLPKIHKVDGHDVGSGEVNIFIETDDPQRLYNEVKSLLSSRAAWSDIRIAYREADGDRYAVLWPRTLHEFDVD